MGHRLRVRRAALAVGLLAASVAAACSAPAAARRPATVVTGPPSRSAAPGGHRSATSGASPTTAEPASPTRQSAARALAAQFATLRASVPARVGIAFASPGQDPVVLGDYDGAVAWSTIKVPLAVAVLESSPSHTALQAMRAALMQSDNAAAQALWNSLGGGQAAAAQVDAILSDNGDPTTRTVPHVTRPGFSAFGQTRWPLGRQAQFAAHLVCDSNAAPVLRLMGEVTPSQRWGLGRIPNARFKGGWGPAPSGGYTVRQFGILRGAHGWTAVAVAVAPHDGTFATGTRQLDRLADWVAAHRGDLPSAGCAGTGYSGVLG